MDKTVYKPIGRSRSRYLNLGHGYVRKYFGGQLSPPQRMADVPELQPTFEPLADLLDQIVMYGDMYPPEIDQSNAPAQLRQSFEFYRQDNIEVWLKSNPPLNAAAATARANIRARTSQLAGRINDERNLSPEQRQAKRGQRYFTKQPMEV